MLLIHDLRNLLTVTAARVDSMLALENSDSRMRAHLCELSQCLDSMFELVDELLPANGGAPHTIPQRVDLDALVANRVTMFRSAAGQNVALVVEPSAGGAVVMARPLDVERVLLNLVLNASEAMPRGGVVTLRTVVLEPGSPETHGASSMRAIRLTVADTGGGMSRYWQQFDQRDEWSERRGLGLASVKLIVLRLGGRFHVDCQEGVGTMVHIDLPVAD